MMPAPARPAVEELPELVAPGGDQMERDEQLLELAAGRHDDEELLLVRRYFWNPPCLSLGRFQRLMASGAGDRSLSGSPGAQFSAGAGRTALPDEITDELPFDVVRRPSGGRAVLHGRDFEWSFAIVFPRPVQPPAGTAAGGVAAPYEIVSAAMARALIRFGVPLQAGRGGAYQRSALCFASSLRHDLLAGEHKIVAVAQARRGRATLVHGSVLERRPPADLTIAVEKLVGEPWEGDGLAAATATVPAREPLWEAFMDELEAELGSQGTCC